MVAPNEGSTREVITIARGVAQNTEANKRYLEVLEGVTSVSFEDDSPIMFTFDPAKKPTESIPDGVYFDLAEAPF